MTMASTSRVRGLLRQLLHLNEPPHRTALAFAIGVFLTFSPPYGLHMLMALACAWAFRLNLAALVAGLCLNTPWTIVPTLAFSLWLGCMLLGIPFPTALEWSDTSATGIFREVAPYTVPFFVGSLVLSVIGGLAAYPIAHWLLLRFRPLRTGEPTKAPLPRQTDIG